MTDSNASKWNARYAWSGGGIPAPAQVLSQGARWLPDANMALALALIRMLCDERLILPVAELAMAIIWHSAVSMCAPGT